MAPERNSRTLDWRDELDWISNRLEGMPEQARRAVLATLAHFRDEDESKHQAAQPRKTS